MRSSRVARLVLNLLWVPGSCSVGMLWRNDDCCYFANSRKSARSRSDRSVGVRTSTTTKRSPFPFSPTLGIPFPFSRSAVALEAGMASDMWMNQKIPWWAAIRVRFSLARQTNDHAVIDSRRNLHFQSVREKSIATPLTDRTGRLHDLPSPLTTRAGRHRHEPHVFPHLHVLLLSGPSTIRTGHGFVPALAPLPPQSVHFSDRVR
jgi:hypothetical protein